MLIQSHHTNRRIAPHVLPLGGDTWPTEVVPRLPGHRGAADLAVINAGVELVRALAEAQAQLVAQQQAALTREAGFAVEPAHGVAPADGETLLRRERRAVPLAAPAALVTPAKSGQAGGRSTAVGWAIGSSGNWSISQLANCPVID